MTFLISKHPSNHTIHSAFFPSPFVPTLLIPHSKVCYVFSSTQNFSYAKFSPYSLTPNSNMSSLYPNSGPHSFTSDSRTYSLSQNSLLSHPKLSPLHSSTLLPLSTYLTHYSTCLHQNPVCQRLVPSPSNLSQCPHTPFYYFSYLTSILPPPPIFHSAPHATSHSFSPSSPPL